MFALKFEKKQFLELFSPIYTCLQFAIPLIGLYRKQRRHKSKNTWRARPRIERPWRRYILAFRWLREAILKIRSDKTRVKTKPPKLLERFCLITEGLLKTTFKTVLLQKFNHYKVAIANLHRIRVRYSRFKRGRGLRAKFFQKKPQKLSLTFFNKVYTIKALVSR